MEQHPNPFDLRYQVRLKGKDKIGIHSITLALHKELYCTRQSFTSTLVWRSKDDTHHSISGNI